MVYEVREEVNLWPI